MREALAALGGLAAATGCAGTDGGGPLAALNRIFSARGPREVPPFAFEDADGRSRTLAELAPGRPVLLHLWAPWCAPCVRELPALGALRARFSGTPLAVVAVSVDRRGVGRARTVLAALEVEGLEPFADPDMDVARTLGLRGLPTTLLIDARGREIGRTRAAQAWETTHAAREVARRLGLAVPPPTPPAATEAAAADPRP